MSNEYEYAAYLEYCAELETIYGPAAVFETTATVCEDLPF